MKSRHYSRRTVLTGLGFTVVGGAIGMKFLKPFKPETEELMQLPNAERMPALFVGHGSPMNAIESNEWTAAWQELGKTLPKPKAILALSAHWLTHNGLLVTASERPPMTYDFGGFPPELSRQQYPAPGDPALAKDIESTLQVKIPIQGDTRWGFDHGTWVVLKHMFPKADIPVIQLSMDYRKPPSFHYEVAKLLQPLRNKGVLIFGSGNLVHNLRAMVRTDNTPFDWAQDFDTRMHNYIQDGNHQAVLDFQKLGSLAEMAHPTYDHFLPIFYALGLQSPGEEFRTFCGGFQYKSVSMRSYRIG